MFCSFFGIGEKIFSECRIFFGGFPTGAGTSEGADGDGTIEDASHDFWA